MNSAYKDLLPDDFDLNSRVWIYQSSREFSLEETLKIEELLNAFTKSWKSHGTPVKGFGAVFFTRFVVLMADEQATGVSGCSTDSSVRLIKEIEQLFQVNFFDRQKLAFIIDDKIEVLPLNQLQISADVGSIKPETHYINNTVLSKHELENNWIVPVQKSWLNQRIQFKTALGSL